MLHSRSVFEQQVECLTKQLKTALSENKSLQMQMLVERSVPNMKLNAPKNERTQLRTKISALTKKPKKYKKKSDTLRARDHLPGNKTTITPVLKLKKKLASLNQKKSELISKNTSLQQQTISLTQENTALKTLEGQHKQQHADLIKTTQEKKECEEREKKCKEREAALTVSNSELTNQNKELTGQINILTERNHPRFATRIIVGFVAVIFFVISLPAMMISYHLQAKARRVAAEKEPCASPSDTVSNEADNTLFYHRPIVLGSKFDFFLSFGDPRYLPGSDVNNSTRPHSKK